MARADSGPGGLTLIEVLVALVVTAAVVLTGRAIADQLASSSRTTSSVIDARLIEMSRAAELRRTFRLVATPIDTTMVFEGGVDHMTLESRCTVARGWDEPCRCRLRVERVGLPVALVRTCSAARMHDTLVVDSSGITLRYLVDAGRGGQWLAEWGKSNTPPIAIGVVRTASRDTLIVRIGTRG